MAEWCPENDDNFTTISDIFEVTIIGHSKIYNLFLFLIFVNTYQNLQIKVNLQDLLRNRKASSPYDTCSILGASILKVNISEILL